MPPSKSSRTPPTTNRNVLWVALAAVVLIVAAVAYFFWMKPASAPVAPVATAPIPALPAPAPIAKRHIYSETADPKADIAAALVQAKREHKRVILDFGGDWCGDCQVLDIYFHQSPNVEMLTQHFILVHVWIGHMDTNLDLAAKYGVPVHSGVPALAVLSANSAVLYSQKTGEFRDMRRMESSSVTEFLNQWKS